MYRVTPMYNGNDLVAIGVQIEGYSVEDAGDGICFNVFAYNAQPGIIIDYATGNSKLDDGTEFPTEAETESNVIDDALQTYILNTSTKKYHKPTCSSATSMSEANKAEFTGSRDELEQQGYSPCGSCKP